MSQVEAAVLRDARVLVGGARVAGPGRFYPPTVLTDVAPDSDLVSTEIFGPVAAILTFEDEDEAVRRAKRLGVGPDRARVHPAFGGIKQSGLGREGGRVGIEEFLEYKYVAMPAR